MDGIHCQGQHHHQHVSRPGQRLQRRWCHPDNFSRRHMEYLLGPRKELLWQSSSFSGDYGEKGGGGYLHIGLQSIEDIVLGRCLKDVD